MSNLPQWAEVVFTFAILLVSIVGMTATLLWTITKLLINPIREDIYELKELVKKITPRENIQQQIDLAIAKHHEDCKRK